MRTASPATPSLLLRCGLRSTHLRMPRAVPTRALAVEYSAGRQGSLPRTATLLGGEKRLGCRNIPERFSEFVQVSFRVLRLTSDPQRGREISCDARSVNTWNIQTGRAIRGECVARGARKDA